MFLRITVFIMMAVGLLGFGTIAWLTLQPPAAAAGPNAAPVQQVGVLVAARDLQAGALLKPDDVAVIQLAHAKVPENATFDTSDGRRSLVGSMVRRRLGAGEPLAASDLLRPGEHGFLAAVLGAGMRAVTVGVDAISGTAGLIWPGDHVDVMLTQQVDDPTRPVGRRTAAETVLQDVRVIAIDQQLVQGASPGSADAKPAATVTLEVSSSQAERVSVATRLGKLSLLVRAARSNPDVAATGPLAIPVAVPNGTAAATPPATPAITWASDVSPALDGDKTAPPSVVKVYGGNGDGKEFHF